MSDNLQQILAERGSRYGSFVTHAEISQEIKQVLGEAITNNPRDFSDDQRECMEMIAHKLARIVNGDPDYADSWRDIAGYATLVADRLDAEAVGL